MNKWLLIFSTLLLSVYSIVSNAQVGQTGLLDVETTPPDSIVVCGDSAFFSVEITNTHSQQLTGLVFNPKMIPGMIYIAGSVTGMAEQNIATLNEPLFSLNAINPNQTIVLTFYAKAECSIIDQVINLGNGSSSGGLATNETRVDYLNNGASEFSLEFNGSNSYNILYADIFISTITNQVRQTIPGAVYSRNISIQNGGLGKVESLTLLIDFETGVAVSGTNIGNFNLSGQVATVTFGPADFAMFGNGDGYFELDEVISLVDTVTMLTCDGGETKYTAFWGCNPLDTCQKDNAYANTILIGGQPILQSDIVINEPTFFGCADTGIVAVEYNNIGIESSVGGANYYNVRLRYESNQEIVNYVGVDLNGADIFNGVPTTTVVISSNGNLIERKEILLDNYFTTDPDGPGGLEDLDNDGYYDDMAIGETLLVTYKYLLESPASFANCPTDFSYLFFRETIYGYNNCGTVVRGQISRNGTVQGYPDGAALVTGPSDISPTDTITITFENSFEFSESGRFKSAFPSSFISTLKCDSSQIKTYLTLDPGFQVVPGSVLANGVQVPFTVNGSLITIFGGELIGRQTTNHFSLDLTYDCSIPVTVGGILEWRTVLSCDCGDEINLGCQSQFISRQCPGPPCFGTRSFDVERATFGWTDATQSTPVTASTPGLSLERAYECDTVCAYASGDIGVGTGISLDNAHVNVWYRAPALDQSFNYGRGEWIIYDASTGTTHRVPTTTPSFTTNGAPSSTHQMTFDATSAILSTVGLLEDGDSLNIKLYLAVNKTDDFPLGAYQFPRFRAQHAYIDALGDTITCSSYGAKFAILKTKTFIQTASGSTNLGNFSTCGEHTFLFGSKLIGGLGVLDDFPNEFRPVNVWNDTLFYTLPQGVYYVPGSIQFNNGTPSTVNPGFDPVTRELTLIGSELFTNGWPLLDRVDDLVRTIEFRVSRDCDAIIGNNDIPSEYGYTGYAHAPDPSCYEPEIANTEWDIVIDKPDLEIDASLTIIEGFERDLQWNIRLCNNGNIFSDNNWIYINDTSGNLTVVNIIDLSNGGISVPFTQVGTYIYVNTGMLLESSCMDLEITSLNNDCTPGRLNTLEVFSGWSCTPDSMYNPMACHTDTIPLSYITKRANLQTRVTFPPNNRIDICTPFDFKVLLISSLEGDMGDITHFVDLPVGLSILPGATYEYPLGTAPQPLPLPTNQFGTNTAGWDLTSIIPGLTNGFTGTRDTMLNKLKLNYSMIASCDFDPYNLVGINSNGYTNCGELVDLAARKKILINGFPVLDSTGVNLILVDNSSTCLNQVSAVVNVQNNSIGNLSLLNRLEVTLPAGMNYVLGSHVPDPIVQQQGGGTELLTFEYPNPLGSGATATFNFDLNLDQAITCGPYSIIARSLIRDTAFCALVGQNCEIGATTGADTSAISVQTTIDPSFTTSVIEPCLGDSFSLASIATCGTHFWDFGDGNTSTAVNPTHTYTSTPGLYTITHIVTGLCSVDTNVTTINVLNLCCVLDLTITSTGVNCNGSCDGTATAVVSNGTAPYTYLWGNLSTTSTITNLCAGTYAVTVIDAAGCSETAMVSILDNTTLLEGSITSSDVTCGGACDGITTVTPIGGTAPYTYAWSNGSTTISLGGLCAGTYMVTITDANGCDVVLTTVITEPTALTLTTTSTGINCNGNCDGTATTVASNGTAPYTYAWSNGSTAISLSGLCAGTYGVTVTDANGCTTAGSVNVDSTALLAASIASTDVTCAGTCDGTATASPIAGTAPYTYAWSDGSTSNSLTSLCAGTYTVTIADANGCDVVVTTVITEPTALTLTTTSTGINCNGNCDGTATTVASNGTAPYTYAWSNGSTTSSLSGLCAGAYEVTVTDANGCTTAGNVNVDSTVLLVGDISSTDIICNGSCDGTTTASPIGGTAPYTYAWSNGSANSSLSGLCAGTYTVTIADASGCDVVLTTVITEPTALAINITTTDASCDPNPDTTTCIATAWRNNRHAVWLPNLPNTPDRKFVFENNSGRLHQYSNGTARITGIIVNRSNSNQRWAVDVHFTNGMDWTSWSALGRSYKDQSGVAGQNYIDWTYYIMDATKANTLTGLGSYSGTVLNLTHKPANYTYGLQVGLAANDKDADFGFSCWFKYRSADGSLRGRGDFNADLNCANAPSCDGTAQATTTGGTAPYTYTWSNGSSSNSLTGLCADTFNVTVTDANGCSTDTTIIIDAEVCCNVTIAATSTNVTCAGSCDGTISSTLTGGLAPYTYAWSNGSTTSNLNGLCAGTYTLTVTDANGCTTSVTRIITEPSVTMVSVSVTNVSSQGASNGSITANPSGGTSPYTYLWSNGQTTQTISGLSAGTYTVTVTDANACIAIATGTITEPFICDGFRTQTQGGWGARPRGNNPGVYLHSNFASAFPNGLVVGCTNTLTFTTAQAITNFLPTGSAPSALPSGNITNPTSYRNVFAGQVTALSLSVGFDNYDSNFGTSSANLKDLVILSGTFAGWTVQQLLDEANQTIGGCASNYSFSALNNAVSSVNQNYVGGNTTGSFLGCPLNITLVQTDPNCIGTNVGSIDLTVSAGSAPYTYTWSNGATTEDVTNLLAGVYSVTVTDANGLIGTASTVIVAPICCSVSTTSTNTNCPESCDGTVCVINATGTAPYTYQWSNGGNTATLSAVCAGTYTVTVTDVNGCVSTATAVVTSPDPIVVTIDTIINESCTGNDGSVSVNVTGGTAPYTIDLANFTTAITYSNSTGNFTGLNAGQYILNVTDANGCTIVCATTFIINGCNCTIPASPARTNNTPILRINSTPSTLQINYQTSEKVIGLSILDSKGKILLNKENLKTTDELNIPTTNWTENTYWIILRGDNGRLIQTKKVIISE